MKSGSIHILPEYSGKYKEGAAALVELEMECIMLNDHLRSMKKSGTFKQPGYKEGAAYIISSYLAENPQQCINADFFKYTGKKIVIDVANFLKYYHGTVEGSMYLEEQKRNAPDYVGKLSTIKV